MSSPARRDRRGSTPIPRRTDALPAHHLPRRGRHRGTQPRGEHARRRALLRRRRVLGDFALAEDAGQEAFLVALERWPRDGTPGNPAAWITTVARNRALDRLRRDRRAVDLEPALLALPAAPDTPDEAIPDDRL